MPPFARAAACRARRQQHESGASFGDELVGGSAPGLEEALLTAVEEALAKGDHGARGARGLATEAALRVPGMLALQTPRQRALDIQCMYLHACRGLCLPRSLQSQHAPAVAAAALTPSSDPGCDASPLCSEVSRMIVPLWCLPGAAAALQ